MKPSARGLTDPLLRRELRLRRGLRETKRRFHAHLDTGQQAADGGGCACAYHKRGPGAAHLRMRSSGNQSAKQQPAAEDE